MTRVNFGTFTVLVLKYTNVKLLSVYILWSMDTLFSGPLLYIKISFLSWSSLQ